MGVRINLDNEALPGVAGERTITMGDELERVQVFDGWVNPCGHVDKYAAVRREAGLAP